jgi:CheY-like chemotaxis protein
MTEHPQAILVVEDNSFLRMDAVDMALTEGFIVFDAENADHAIAILEAHPEIGLVFTDIEMPGSMDGLKLAEFVRHRWPPVHFIVASGKVPRDKAQLPEGSLFFAKPYSHVEILTAMHTLLAC